MFNFKFLRKMNLKRTQQVEAQGVKKLDSFKGFQELNSKELRKVEGGKGDGYPFFELTGVLDGIRHNTHLYLFGLKVF